MIARNTPLPAAVVRVFRTFVDGQPDVLVPIVEGGTDSGAGCAQLGQCIVSDLPADLPKGSPVKVTFQYQTDGQLTVAASLPTAKRQARLVLERAAGMTAADLAAWQQKLAAGLVLEARPVPADEGRESDAGYLEEQAEIYETPQVPREMDSAMMVQLSDDSSLHCESADEEVENESEPQDPRPGRIPETVYLVLGSWFLVFLVPGNWCWVHCEKTPHSAATTNQDN